jgi:uncharacterized protein (DUF2336 family)
MFQRQAFSVSADFRQLAIKGQSGRAERLFRAAVSAYSALTRPTRRDATQLDDLALPLFDSVPPPARRFAAAVLADCYRPPAGLIRRLIDEPVETSAPLLIRSGAISEVDLITAIGRHGLPHARAIARRPRLHPVIANLLDAFRDAEIQRLRGRQPRPALRAVQTASPSRPQRGEGEPAENIRRRLRAMMQPASQPQAVVNAGAAESFGRLRQTALAGHLPLFETALADALGMELAAARRLTRQDSYRDLLAALCRLELTEEQAYLIVAAIFPAGVSGPEAINLFLYRYRLLDAEDPAAASQSEGLMTETRSSAA